MDNLGWKPLIVCNKSPINENAVITDPHSVCEFNHFIILMQNIIHDLIILSTFLAVAAFMWAGFKLMTSGGDVGAKTAAKHAATSVAKGYFVILAAWVVVYTITSVLLRDEFNFILQGVKP